MTRIAAATVTSTTGRCWPGGSSRQPVPAVVRAEWRAPEHGGSAVAALRSAEIERQQASQLAASIGDYLLKFAPRRFQAVPAGTGV
jgi:hypothetical protein